MLNKLKKSNEKGFTIIEVMIVLAIAGLIILIVLLAVPALQRNSRNTAIKNDASALSAALQEFGSINDGQIPTGLTQAGTNVTFTRAASNQSEGRVQASTVVAAAPTFPGGPGAINVAFGVRCNGNAATVASPRSSALLYRIEISGGGTAQQCTDG